MLNRIAILALGATALGAAALPRAASAADYYDGGDARSPSFHGEDGFRGGGERFDRDDLRPTYRVHGARRDPGPVVFDEREPGPHRGGPAYGEDFSGEPVLRDGPYGAPVYGERRPDLGYGRPVGYGPGFAHPDGRGGDLDGFGDGAPFRGRIAYDDVTGPVGSAYGPRPGSPDVGCTVEQAQSVTPAGWRKIVTHRTCYRR